MHSFNVETDDLAAVTDDARQQAERYGRDDVLVVFDIDNTLLADESAGDHWATYGRTFSVRHYSPLDQVNRANVGSLGLAWSRDLAVKQRCVH